MWLGVKISLHSFPSLALTWKENSINAQQRKKTVTKQNEGNNIASARVRPTNFWTEEEKQFILSLLTCYLVSQLFGLWVNQRKAQF